MRSQAPLQPRRANPWGLRGGICTPEHRLMPRFAAGSGVPRAHKYTWECNREKELLREDFIYRLKHRSDELFLWRHQPSWSAVDKSRRISSPRGKPSSCSEVLVFHASCSASREICVQSCLCRSQLASYSDLVYSWSMSETCVLLNYYRAGWELLLQSARGTGTPSHSPSWQLQQAQRCVCFE